MKHHTAALSLTEIKNDECDADFQLFKQRTIKFVFTSFFRLYSLRIFKLNKDL
jgi:hypothetical protein